MCGITGFIDYTRSSSKEQLEKMQKCLQHRGPDDFGTEFFSISDCVIGMAHTRLSIIDTSARGHQPMNFQNFTIILNGEIYNFHEIREELIVNGHCFESNSDTEVVLHAFAEWGTKCVERFIGMFAFAIFDSTNRKIYFCRDRVGVKPLFYFLSNQVLLFGSELKALYAHRQFEKKINHKSLALFLQYGYVPGPASIFENTFKLEPGTWMTLDIDSRKVVKEVYWRVSDFFIRPVSKLNYTDAKTQLESLLLSACKYRMIADVPVGVFLSGGIDSTLVTALLQKNSHQKLRTFTIGFPDGTNEAPYAEQVAKYLGTEHVTYDCRWDDAIKIIPELAYYYDEPSADISAIPTILVSRLACKKVTVALSADGGDELFAGYDGFTTFGNQLETIRKIPFPVFSGRAMGLMAKMIPSYNSSIKRKFKGLEKILTGSERDVVKNLVEESYDIPSKFVNQFLVSPEQRKHPVFEDNWHGFSDERNGFLYYSFQGPLRDYLLVKMDRATMAASLEGREPLLDHRLIEYAAQLPYHFKHDGKTSKRILKDIIYQHVPRDIMDRPKVGFDLPIYRWLQAELQFLLDDLIGDVVFLAEARLNTNAVKQMVKDFRNGGIVYTNLLWRFIVLRLWFRQWVL